MCFNIFQFSIQNLAAPYKNETSQINENRNKREVTSDFTEIQRIIRKHYEQLYTNKLDNLEEMDTFLEIYDLWRLSQEKTKTLNQPITTNEIDQ